MDKKLCEIILYLISWLEDEHTGLAEDVIAYIKDSGVDFSEIKDAVSPEFINKLEKSVRFKFPE